MLDFFKQPKFAPMLFKARSVCFLGHHIYFQHEIWAIFIDNCQKYRALTFWPARDERLQGRARIIVLHTEYIIELASLFLHLLYKFNTLSKESESKSVDHTVD